MYARGVVLVAALAAGCAVPVDLARLEVPPAPRAAQVGGVLVRVVDRRAEVTAGERPPSWLGTSRTTLGIGRDALTASGRAVAADLAAALTRAWGGAEAEPELAVEVALEAFDADGYFGEVTVDYALGLRCTRGDLELAVGRAAGEAAVGYVGGPGFAAACRRVLTRALTEAVADAERAEGEGEAAPRGAAAACAGCAAPLEPGWIVCPRCGLAR